MERFLSSKTSILNGFLVFYKTEHFPVSWKELFRCTRYLSELPRINVGQSGKRRQRFYRHKTGLLKPNATFHLSSLTANLTIKKAVKKDNRFVPLCNGYIGVRWLVCRMLPSTAALSSLARHSGLEVTRVAGFSPNRLKVEKKFVFLNSFTCIQAGQLQPISSHFAVSELQRDTTKNPGLPSPAVFGARLAVAKMWAYMHSRS